MSNDTIMQADNNYFLTLLNGNGGDLREYLVELNQEYAQYNTLKDQGESTLSALDVVRDRIARMGVDRSSMAAVESFVENLPLNSKAPLNSYTRLPSKTNVAVALEEISSRQMMIGGGIAVAAIAIIYKMVRWIINFFKNRNSNIDQAAEVQGKTLKEFEKTQEMTALAGTNIGKVIDGAPKDKGDSIRELWNEKYTIFMEEYRKGNILEKFSPIIDGASDFTDLIKKQLDMLVNFTDEFIDMTNKNDISQNDVDEFYFNWDKKLSIPESDKANIRWPAVSKVLRNLTNQNPRNTKNVTEEVKAIKTYLTGMSERKFHIRPNQYENVMTDLCARSQMGSYSDKAKEIRQQTLDILESVEDGIKNLESNYNTAVENAKQYAGILKPINQLMSRSTDELRQMINGLTQSLMLTEWIYTKLVEFYVTVIHKTNDMTQKEVVANVTNLSEETQEQIKRLRKNVDDDKKDDK